MHNSSNIEFMNDRIEKVILLVLLLNPCLLISQYQSHYPDTIVDSYNAITKTADQFFEGEIAKC